MPLRAIAAMLLAIAGGCGGPDEPYLGEASWGGAPGLPSSLYELTYVTFAAHVWTVKRIESDEPVSCSLAPSYYTNVFVELSEVSGQMTGPVPIVTTELVPTERGAHFVLGQPTFDQGTINMTRVGDTFEATFTAITTTGTQITGRFEAPRCD